MKRVYWDSCCFIDFLQGSERGEVLKGVVDKKDKGELEIATSVVTLTEVISMAQRCRKSRKPRKTTGTSKRRKSGRR